ncbi:MAG: ChbG/HpnK family deacetylase [Vampirovibrionales bacterium]
MSIASSSPEPTVLPPPIILNADDFGMSFGINEAIETLVKHRALNSASLLTSGYAFSDALERATLLRQTHPLFIGLHFNVTYRHSALRQGKHATWLTDASGAFKHSFMSLMLLCLKAYFIGSKSFRFKLLRQLSQELQAQYQQATQTGMVLSHIDGHQHVHLIPMVYHVVERFARKHHIPRIRHIREHFWHTLIHAPNMSIWQQGGWLKWLILQGLQRMYVIHPRYRTTPYFFSLIESCHIDLAPLTRKAFPPKTYGAMEVMVHPSLTPIDKRPEYKAHFAQDAEAPHIFHPSRTLEYESVLHYGPKLLEPSS